MSFFDKLDQLAGVTPGSNFSDTLNALTGGNVAPSTTQTTSVAPSTGLGGTNAPVQQNQQAYQAPSFTMPGAAPAANMPPVGPTQAAAIGQQPVNPLNQPAQYRPPVAGPGTQVASNGPVAPPQQLSGAPIQTPTTGAAPANTNAPVNPNAVAQVPTPMTGVNPATGQVNGQTTNEVTPQDLMGNNIFNSMLGVESGNQNYLPNGQPVTSSAGAKYAAQVMPATANNPGYGIRPAQSDTPEEYNRVGKEYHEAMRKKYQDEEKAVAAYNAGPGRVDHAIALANQKGGNWKDYLPAETKQYLAKVNASAIMAQQDANQMGPSGLTGNKGHDQLIAAGNDPQKLTQIAFNDKGEYDNATRQGAAQTLRDIMDHSSGMERVKAETTRAANEGNILPIVNKANQKTPEGSRFRAMLYELAGAKQAAADEYNRLGVGSAWQPGMVMSPDGKLQRYAVYMGPDGEAKRAINSSTGQEVTDSKELASLNGGGMGAGLKSSGLRQGMTTGNTYDVLSDKYGNTWYKNVQTGEMSPTLKENLGNVGTKSISKEQAEANLKNKSKFISENIKLANQSGGWEHHPTFGSEQQMREAADSQFGTDAELRNYNQAPSQTPAEPTVPVNPAATTNTSAAANTAQRRVSSTTGREIAPFNPNDVIDKAAMDALSGEGPAPTMGKSGFNPQQRAAIQRRINELSESTGIKYDPNKYTQVTGARNKTENDFSSAGVSGKKMIALNTAIDHMDSLRDQIKKLPTGQYPAVNDIVNQFSRNIGDPRINTYDAMASLIAGEITKAVVANGGTGDERAEKEKLLAIRNNPEALRQTLNGYTQLLGGQMHSLKDAYIKGHGNDWESKVNPRTEQAIGESRINRPWSDQDKQAAKWAKENADDHRAADINKRLGLD